MRSLTKLLSLKAQKDYSEKDYSEKDQQSKRKMIRWKYFIYLLIEIETSK